MDKKDIKDEYHIGLDFGHSEAMFEIDVLLQEYQGGVDFEYDDEIDAIKKLIEDHKKLRGIENGDLALYKVAPPIVTDHPLLDFGDYDDSKYYAILEAGGRVIDRVEISNVSVSTSDGFTRISGDDVVFYNVPKFEKLYVKLPGFGHMEMPLPNIIKEGGKRVFIHWHKEGIINLFMEKKVN